ncbi:MAG: hypothetical protein AAF715_18010 [Myxococcota bacterium]
MRRRMMGLGALATATLAGAGVFMAPVDVVEAKRDLGGKWVVASVTTTVAKVPVVGKIYAKTNTVVLHDLKQDGQRLRGGGQLCRLDIDSGSKFVDTKLPEKFKKALPPPFFDGVLTENDEGEATVRTGRRLVVMGARLAKPSRDDLPRDAEDKRVVDQDRDGNPGVTISIDGIVSGDIHVATRSWTRFLGSVQSDRAIRGKVFFDQEQSILGTTTSMLDEPPETKPVPNKSWFRMVRVANDFNCGDARRMTDDWFE